MENGLPDNNRDVIISVLLNLSLWLIFLGKLIIVRMAILLFYYYYYYYYYYYFNRNEMFLILINFS